MKGKGKRSWEQQLLPQCNNYPGAAQKNYSCGLEHGTSRKVFKLWIEWK